MARIYHGFRYSETKTPALPIGRERVTHAFDDMYDVGIQEEGCNRHLSALGLWSVRSPERVAIMSPKVRDGVEINPRKLGGVPVIAGTRVSVSAILAYIADGMSIEEVAAELSLHPDQVRAAICFAARLADQRGVEPEDWEDGDEHFQPY